MKITKFLLAISAAAMLTACSSDTDLSSNLAQKNGLTINGHGVYLRGEMNDYVVSETYRLQSTKYGYCTTAALRADWAPYKFKFADSEWSKGSNFGFLKQPGVLRANSPAIEVNPNSKFEEISFYPNEDGIYRFCLVKQDNKFFASVEKTDKKELLTMAQLLKLSAN